MAKKFGSASQQHKSAISWSRKDQRTDIKSASDATSHANSTTSGGLYGSGYSNETSRTAPGATKSGGKGTVIVVKDHPLYTHQSRQSSNNPAT